jgi:hypothetical protein
MSYCLLRRSTSCSYCIVRCLHSCVTVPAHDPLPNCSGGLFVPASRPCCCVHSCTLTYCCMSSICDTQLAESHIHMPQIFSRTVRSADVVHCRHPATRASLRLPRTSTSFICLFSFLHARAFINDESTSLPLRHRHRHRRITQHRFTKTLHVISRLLSNIHSCISSSLHKLT